MTLPVCIWCNRDLGRESANGSHYNCRLHLLLQARCLAANIHFAAQLGRSFDLGSDYGAWHQQPQCTPEPWEPGTGHSADHECIDCGAPMLSDDVAQGFRTCEGCARERREAR